MKETITEEKLKSSIEALDFDLNAEAFASLLPNGSDFHYLYDTYFKRRYDKDIIEIRESDSQAPFEVSLSRRSLYNVLPEGFFHKPKPTGGDARQMAAAYKERKKEEKSSRKFFAPLENEFFLAKVRNAFEENELLGTIHGPQLTQYLKEIWNINPDIHEATASKIVRVLPLLHQIAGNIPAITELIETITGEKISIGQERMIIDVEPIRLDGTLHLGVNLATQMDSRTFLTAYDVCIEEVNHPDQIELYFDGGNIKESIRYLLEHTIPLESQFEIRFTIPENKQPFVLDDTAYGSRLTISTTL